MVEVTVARAERIAIVGSGSIGTAWAIVFARAGHQVAMYDVDPARVAAVPDEITSRVTALAEFALAPGGAQITDRISVGTDLQRAVAGADYVQECVLESLEVKREVFGRLDALTAPDTVLASSSSMIACSRFAGELAGRARCLVVHPGNPPYLLPVAELVPAPFTSVSTLNRARTLLTTAGMTPIDVHVEVEGFVFNRLQGALLREAYALVRDGVVSATDIDRIVRLGLGRRWSVLGPFGTADLNTRGGLERHATVMGPAYARMGTERGDESFQWPPALVGQIADELHRTQPLSEWPANVERRDRALMVLLAARRDAGLD